MSRDDQRRKNRMNWLEIYDSNDQPHLVNLDTVTEILFRNDGLTLVCFGREYFEARINYQEIKNTIQMIMNEIVPEA